jgi:cytochrome c oxidase subunit 4
MEAGSQNLPQTPNAAATAGATVASGGGASRPPQSPEPRAISHAQPHHHVHYFLIFFALVALTILTVLVSKPDYHNELVNVSLALLIAFTKGGFVARYFMHLKFEGKLIYLILVVPLILTVILVTSLVPDAGALTMPWSHSGSLHLFNNPFTMLKHP